MNSHHFRLSLLLIEILYTSAEQNEHDQEESLPHYEQIKYNEIFAYRDIGIGLLTNAYLLYTSDKYFVKNRFFYVPLQFRVEVLLYQGPLVIKSAVAFISRRTVFSAILQRLPTKIK